MDVSQEQLNPEKPQDETKEVVKIDDTEKDEKPILEEIGADKCSNDSINSTERIPIPLNESDVKKENDVEVENPEDTKIKVNKVICDNSLIFPKEESRLDDSLKGFPQDNDTYPDLKRKRRSLSVQENDSTCGPKSKRKKINATSDNFCWRCHKESVEAHCSACPRSWHRKCMGGDPLSSSMQNWICGECATILRAENAESRSPAMAQLSIDQLCMLLKHVVQRMRDYPGSEPFWKPVHTSEVPNYMEYIIKPMDVGLLESNVRAKLYGSTDAFMADAKWIQHNCIVFNTCGGVYADTSKLTNAAKQMIKVARQEVSEIEACPDCYAHGRNLPRPQPQWFIEPCRQPHVLVWAKLKGFPFWPAKAMPRTNAAGHVDVRFFGQHDRAWVPPRDIYLYSQDPPAPLPRKRTLDMDECIKEINIHCRKLELAFGKFEYAPAKVQYNPSDKTQIKLLLPNFDPLTMTVSINSNKRKTPLKKRLSSMKDKSLNDSTATVDSTTNSESEENKNTSKTQKSNKSLNNSDVTSVNISSPKKQDFIEEKDGLNLKEDEDEIQEIPSADVVNNVTPNEKKANSVHNDHSEAVSKLQQEDSTNQRQQSNSQNTPLKQQSHSQPVVLTKKRKAVTKNHNNKNQNSKIIKVMTKLPKSMASKVYKPKTRMVDKVKAEEALKALRKDEQDQTPEQIVTSSSIKSDTTLTTPPSDSNSSPNKTVPPKLPLLLVMKNQKAHNKNNQSKILADNNMPIKDTPQKSITQSPQKKESKARKSFQNKSATSPNAKIVQKPSPNALPNSPNSMIYIPSQKNESNTDSYQMIPPEAGPLSAHLYNGAQELAKRIAQLMEEVYKETSDFNSTSDKNNKQISNVHFLRLQIERMRWQHQQQLAELKHNTDRVLREMRGSMEAERLRAIEETRKEAEEEKKRCIEETKRKQWCAMCGSEAMFYCCWNTAYCDYPCQQSHWPSHMRNCAQQPSFTTVVTSSNAGSTQQQQNNNTVPSNPTVRANVLSPRSKLTAAVPTQHFLPPGTDLKTIKVQQK